MNFGARERSGGRSDILLPAVPSRRVSVPGHLGEFLQGRLGPRGPVALMTLPCPLLRVDGFWRPGRFALFQPGRPVLTAPQIARLLHHLGLPLQGAFTLRADMPLGGGAGSSTAALLAVAQLAGWPKGNPFALAQATLAAEGASDPLMFPRPAGLLWASRQGRILADLPPLPRLSLLGGFFGAPRRTDPQDNDFPDISDLAAQLPKLLSSAQDLAAIASESARRSLSARGDDNDPTQMLARSLGALGFAIGHTGPARVLIFARGQVPPEARTRLIAAGFRGLVGFDLG